LSQLPDRVPPSSVQVIVNRDKYYSDIGAVKKTLDKAENESSNADPFKCGKHVFQKHGHAVEPGRNNQPINNAQHKGYGKQ
jgi:hypothetical protein